MELTEIQGVLDQLNAACRAAKAEKKVKKVAKPAVESKPKVNGHTPVTADDFLLPIAKRIAAATGLASRGFSAEQLVSTVLEYEKPYKGVVQ